VTPPRVLLIGGAGEAVVAAPVALGAEVVHVQQRGRLDPRQRALAAETIELDLAGEPGDPDAVVRTALEHHARAPFAAVVSMTELGLVPAARIAAATGLPGASTEATARLLRDKVAMRAHLAGFDGLAVRAAACPNAQAAREFVDAVGPPVIVKPRSGSASLAVHRVDAPSGADGLVAAVEAVLAVSPDGAVIEEFLTGREFSVESFSFAGDHRVVAITEKFTMAGFVEVGHLVPARLEPAAIEAVGQRVAEFLTAVGVTDGPAHTEIVLTDAGVRVIESHDRLGGDRIFRLVELATGIDLVTWCFAWPLGLMAPPAPLPAAARAAAIRFLTPPPGVVRAVKPSPDLLAGASAAAGPGYRIDELVVAVGRGEEIRDPRDSWDRSGHVIVTGPDPDEAPRRALAAARAAAAGLAIDPP